MPAKPTGQRLEMARIAAGYRTAKEFSDKHGISQSTYNLHESGKRGLKLEVAAEYAKVLGLASTSESSGSKSASLIDRTI